MSGDWPTCFVNTLQYQWCPTTLSTQTQGRVMTGGGGIQLMLQQCILLLSIHPCPAVRGCDFPSLPFFFCRSKWFWRVIKTNCTSQTFEWRRHTVVESFLLRLSISAHSHCSVHCCLHSEQGFCGSWKVKNTIVYLECPATSWWIYNKLYVSFS